MTTAFNIWPQPDTPAYDELARRFLPVFDTIRQGAVERDAKRQLPHEEVRQLKDLKFGALIIDQDSGGLGGNLQDLVALLIALAEADSNIPQIFRAHFGFIGSLLYRDRSAWAQRWLEHAVAGDIFAAGYTEPGQASWAQFFTTLTPQKDSWRLNGKKFYTTGALFAERLVVSATRDTGLTAQAVVPTDAAGLRIDDDWNGFGQKLTASGTALLDNVRVDEDDIAPVTERWPFLTAFAQLAHLATLAGIGRAVADGATRYIRDRTRTYSHAIADSARDDPQILQLLGNVYAKVHAANTLVLAAARTFEHAVAAGDGSPAVAARVDIETYQAQVVVSEIILEATTIVFNALGASALSTTLGFDRFWRNARTIASHNPVIYKERIIGDYVVNEKLPPEFWIAGTARRNESGNGGKL